MEVLYVGSGELGEGHRLVGISGDSLGIAEIVGRIRPEWRTPKSRGAFEDLKKEIGLDLEDRLSIPLYPVSWGQQHHEISGCLFIGLPIGPHLDSDEGAEGRPLDDLPLPKLR